MTEIKTFCYKGFTIKEGGKYKWSGTDEYLYHVSTWKKDKCRVVKIDGDRISIKQSIFSKNFAEWDSPDEVVEFSAEKLNKLRVEFHKR